MPWLLPFALTSLSFVAAIASIWCYVRARKLLRGASSRSLLGLNEGVSELELRCDSLATQLKRLQARVGMRELREKRAVEAETPESVAQATIDREKLKELARARGHKLT